MDDSTISALLEHINAQSGDIVFFGAGKSSVVNKSIGGLRDYLAQCFDLYTTKWAPVWIIDPPLFELDGNNRYSSVHHPFTSPVDDNAVDANSLSKAYDLVLNGSEVGGGSIRIHKLDVQKKIFEMLGMDPEHAAEVSLSTCVEL